MSVFPTIMIDDYRKIDDVMIPFLRSFTISQKRVLSIRHNFEVEPKVFKYQENNKTSEKISQMKKQIDLGVLTENCIRRYPLITSNLSEMDGIPYLRGTNLTVCSILDGLYFKNNSLELIRHYPILKESQVKEAILFASTFIELAYK